MSEVPEEGGQGEATSGQSRLFLTTVHSHYRAGRRNEDGCLPGTFCFCGNLDIAAGRMVLRELNRLVESRAEFAFESTLSGLYYAKRLEDWKSRSYLIEIVYIRLASPQLALSRIASRVRQGGHDVPRTDVIRRFKRGWTNFLNVYQTLADHWAIYENSESKPKLLERGP